MPDAEAFDIDADTGELAFVEPPSHVVGGDNSYEVHVEVTDTDGQSDIQVITDAGINYSDLQVFTDAGINYSDVQFFS